MEVEQTQQQIGDVLKRQRMHFSGGNTLGFADRARHLLKLENALISHKNDILEALRLDLNKPAVEGFLAEYYFLLQEIRLVRRSLKKWLKRKRVQSPIYFQPCRSEICHEPYGVVLVVAPWNYPIQLALAPLVSAIAAGNTVVLKPSELSSASEAFLVKLLASIFPTDLVHVQTGGVEVASALLGEKFDFIFFTGSTEVGKIVARKAAESLTPSVLELGGKCPCIVDSSADIKLAAGRILSGKFFNGGQTCFAPDFVIVHESVEQELLSLMKSELERVPWCEEMAHVINEHHYQRLTDLLDGVDTEQVVCSGKDDVSHCKMAPRLVSAIGWDHCLLKEEVFGPILPIVSYSNESELLERLSTYSDPLALYLFAEDKGFCKRIQQSKRSGAVCINDTMKQSSNLYLPFGGVGDSGNGRYRGEFGVKAFSYQRAVVKRGKLGAKWMDLKPPYGRLMPWFERFMR
ncbi:MAG: aldehyde dehydrogenase family protein [Rubritalea sp.]|uniref:aldehyde dehydrogenase family protein n=1 Tax=Rubritalea sp. TaxID=2109375 RepID=UPI0032421042